MGMKAFRFCANLDYLFQETDLLSRYHHAQRAGFLGVETANPYKVPLAEIAKAKRKSGLRQILINSPADDDSANGRFGCASIPGKQDKFREGLGKAALYAMELKCPFIHIMSGVVENQQSIREHHCTLVANLKEAVGVLEPLSMYGLIEPINTPNYYMDSYEKAVSAIEDVGSSNIRILLDVFHLQQIRGNLTRSIANLLPFIKHMQIAQVPGRHEPDSPGEIDYDYVFSFLEQLGYDGWIGLEYHPKKGTEAGLTWLKEKQILPF